MEQEVLKAAAQWIIEEWSVRLAAAIATMTDSKVEPSAGPGPGGAAFETAPQGLDWYRFSIGLDPDAILAVGAEPAHWNQLGSFALTASGLTDPTVEDIESTSLEMLNQAGSGLAQALTRRIGRDVTAQPVQRTASPPEAVLFAAYQFPLGDSASLRVFIAVSPLAASLPVAPEPDFSPPPPAPETAPASAPPLRPSRTLDLLMEVELPVSVSFGRAYIALRDVIKLNSGSIVELNRTVHDPVEIIVNNCVIARGEVVVVDGNYGVRIQQVVSREERLRTLN
jgi:flagellar motor switch protein FliN